MKNKNSKKAVYITLSVFLIVLLLSSCRNEPLASSGDAYSYIKFEEAESRAVITYTLEKYCNLYWFYKAEKVYGDGITGTRTEWTPINLDGDNNIQTGLGTAEIGPFSQGKWKFELKAYKTAKVATEKPSSTEDYASYTYEATSQADGSSSTVETTIYFSLEDPIYETGSGGMTATLAKSYETIAVNVENAGETGTVIFENLYFITDAAVSEDTKVEITFTRTDNASGETAYTFDSADMTLGSTEESGKYRHSLVISSGKKSSIKCGTYECLVTEYGTDKTNPSFTGKLYFAVYGNVTTLINGEVPRT